MTAAVALAHDNLAARAGGERVVAALAAAWPGAPIHTMMHEPAETFTVFRGPRVQASRLNRFALLRRHYRAAFFAMPLLWSARTIDADVTICSTSGQSHHVRTTGAKIVYCHTPARWMYDTEGYLQGFNRAVSAATSIARPPLRWWDQKAMRAADAVVANSHQIAAEIEEVYGIAATVIPPCSTLDIDGEVSAIDGVEPGFFIAPMRPLGYKRLDVLIEAARRRPDLRFVHIGDGPHRAQLFADAPANIVSLGAVTDAELRWAYHNARAAVMTCAEDFGLVPLEAAAHGLSTIAPDARGLRDHDEATLSTYEFASVDALVDAFDRVASPTGVTDETHLGQVRFINDIKAVIATL